MSDLDRFSLIVAQIYDAALDPALWPSVLRDLCAFVPGAYGNIFIQDAANQAANSVFTWGMQGMISCPTASCQGDRCRSPSGLPAIARPITLLRQLGETARG